MARRPPPVPEPPLVPRPPAARPRGPRTLAVVQAGAVRLRGAAGAGGLKGRRAAGSRGGARPSFGRGSGRAAARHRLLDAGGGDLLAGDHGLFHAGGRGGGHAAGAPAAQRRPHGADRDLDLHRCLRLRRARAGGPCARPVRPRRRRGAVRADDGAAAGGDRRIDRLDPAAVEHGRRRRGHRADRGGRQPGLRGRRRGTLLRRAGPLRRLARLRAGCGRRLRLGGPCRCRGAGGGGGGAWPGAASAGAARRAGASGPGPAGRGGGRARCEGGRRLPRGGGDRAAARLRERPALRAGDAGRDRRARAVAGGQRSRHRHGCARRADPAARGLARRRGAARAGDGLRGGLRSAAGGGRSVRGRLPQPGARRCGLRRGRHQAAQGARRAGRRRPGRLRRAAARSDAAMPLDADRAAVAACRRAAGLA